jgi:hypothetical protein
MSFGVYMLGFAILTIGLAIGAHLAHMPNQWVAVGVICMIGVGIILAVTSTRRRDPS